MRGNHYSFGFSKSESGKDLDDGRSTIGIVLNQLPARFDERDSGGTGERHAAMLENRFELG